jgi:hypothetical protein
VLKIIVLTLNPELVLLEIKPLILIAAVIYILLAGGALTSMFFSNFKKLYPEIEFRFGPEHKQYILKKRKGIKRLLSIYIIPTLISIAINIFIK